MTISAVIARLREMKASTAMIEFVVLAIEEAKDEASRPIRQRRQADSERQSRHRDKTRVSRDSHVTVTGGSNVTVTPESQPTPPLPLSPQTPLSPHPHPAPPPQAHVREPAAAADPDYPTQAIVRQWAESVMVPEICADNWHAERTATQWTNRYGMIYATDHGALRALFTVYATKWKEVNANINARESGKKPGRSTDTSHGEKDQDTW